MSSGVSHKEQAYGFMHYGKRHGQTLEQVLDAVRVNRETQGLPVEPVARVVRERYDGYTPKPSAVERRDA